MATSFFRTEIVEEKQERKNQTAHITPSIRKSFFLRNKENNKETIENLSQQTLTETQASDINSQSEYMKLADRLDKYRDKIYRELFLKFKRISQDSKDLRDIRNSQHMKAMLSAMFMDKELWYKTSFVDKYSQNKMVLFFKFYSCQDKTNKPRVKLVDTCYLLQVFNFKKGQWHQVSVDSSVIGLIWNNDVAYTQIEVNALGTLASDTNSLIIVVPVPKEQMPMQYLKYESGKMTWVEGSEVRWNLSGQKEMDRFETWSQNVESEQSETPEQ